MAPARKMRNLLTEIDVVEGDGDAGAAERGKAISLELARLRPSPAWGNVSRTGGGRCTGGPSRLWQAPRAERRGPSSLQGRPDA